MPPWGSGVNRTDDAYVRRTVDREIASGRRGRIAVKHRRACTERRTRRSGRTHPAVTVPWAAVSASEVLAVKSCARTL